MKAILKLRDSFSGANNTIKREVTDQQYSKLSDLAGSNKIVWREFSSGIAWDWCLVSIKIVKP